MDAPLVLKFGGAALSNGARVVRAIERVAATPRPIAVVSAVAGATDLLDQMAQRAAAGGDPDPLAADIARFAVLHRSLASQLELDPDFLNQPLHELRAVLDSIRARGRISGPEHDFVLSFGERISARIFARALRARGVVATPIDAFDLGLVSDSNHGRARPLPEALTRVRASLSEIPGVPVITGFVAADREGRVTTLGRDGTDLTASWIAAAVGAREVQFWKWVPGVASADPEHVPGARALERLSYADARMMARWGARVLHPDALDPLEQLGIPARVLCAADEAGEPERGTRISAGRPGAAVGVAVLRELVLVRGPRAQFQSTSLLWKRPSPDWAGLFPKSVAPACRAPWSLREVACATCFGARRLADVCAFLESQRMEIVEAFEGDSPRRVHVLLDPLRIDAVLPELHAYTLAGAASRV